MRSMALACLIALAVAGCEGKPLLGIEAQRDLVEAQRSNGKLPAGVVLVVDGVRVPDSVHLGPYFLRDLDSSTIDYVTITINPAVLRRYGPNAKRVYLIHTKRAGQPHTPLEKVRARPLQ